MVEGRGLGGGTGRSPAAASRAHGCGSGPVATQVAPSQATPARGRRARAEGRRVPNASTSSCCPPAISVCAGPPARCTRQSPAAIVERLAVLPAESGPGEDEEDLLLPLVGVHRGRASSGIDLDVAQAGRDASSGATEVTPDAGQRADLDTAPGDVVPVDERRGGHGAPFTRRRGPWRSPRAAPTSVQVVSVSSRRGPARRRRLPRSSTAARTRPPGVAAPPAERRRPASSPGLVDGGAAAGGGAAGAGAAAADGGSAQRVRAMQAAAAGGAGRAAERAVRAPEARGGGGAGAPVIGAEGAGGYAVPAVGGAGADGYPA